MIRSLAIASLIATQLVATPVAAAELQGDRSSGVTATGSFAGARVRLPLGGSAARERLRAGLVMAPTLHSEQAGGRVATRFGEGLEFGFGPARRGVALSLAGRPLTGEGRDLPGTRAGVSTLGWVAIGVGAVALILVAAAVTCQETNCLGSE
jgi:hypothetical protein